MKEVKAYELSNGELTLSYEEAKAEELKLSLEAEIGKWASDEFSNYDNSYDEIVESIVDNKKILLEILTRHKD